MNSILSPNSSSVKETFFNAAMGYHNEGLCVIPIVPGDKMPATKILNGTWDRYKTTRSTAEEIEHWWANGHKEVWNIGIVHGEVSDGYIAIDIDKDAGIFEAFKKEFGGLTSGRIEQSGSGRGFHIPIRMLESLPEFGNRTWKTELGDFNIRVANCQTVAPPSIHPSGNPYRFIQEGDIQESFDLTHLMQWLDSLVPEPKKITLKPKKVTIHPQGDDLKQAVIDYWVNALTVFAKFGFTTNMQQERNGELRLLGNGGLLIKEDHDTWHCFSDEFGGGIFEAWAFCNGIGPNYDKHTHFRKVLVEMAQVAGIDIAKFYKKGDGDILLEPEVKEVPAKRIWTKKYGGAFGKLRTVQQGETNVI